MKDLIEALNIFLKYENLKFPTFAELDRLYVIVRPDSVSEMDKILLKELSFEPDDGGAWFESRRFGDAEDKPLPDWAID